MEQFSLEKYLENPSRKVVTRKGNPVRILCTDCGVMMSHPILTEICSGKAKVLEYHYIDGTTQNKNNDLFFADEELIEFEKELQIIISEASHWTSEDGSISTYCQFGDKEIKKISAQVLDLARNEIEKDNIIIDKDKYLKICDQYYNNGKQDALKFLPKWKKLSSLVCFDRTNSGCFAFIGNDTAKPAICCNGYYISLADLETLPKEE